MSELRLSFPASAIIARGRLTSHEIDLLKAEVFPDGVVDDDGAALLFAINTSCRHAGPDWPDYFIGSMTGFLLHGMAPAGQLDDAKTLWLERMLAADGIVSTELELRLLLHVMEAAPHVPDSLKVFVLSQLRHAIHGGSGALAGRRHGQQRGISSADIDFLRTLLEVKDDERQQIDVSAAVHRVLLSIDAVSNPALNDRDWIPFLYSVRAPSTAPAHVAARKSRPPAGRSSFAA